MTNQVIDKSIAVLPFINMSADPDNEYFSDGITEEIINALTRIQGLNVTARTSSFAFKNKHQDVREIAKALGVSAILEGSVRKSNSQLRISAQLIQADEGFHLWSENFDREMCDIFQLQDEISLLIADQIRENFGHIEVQDHLIDTPDVAVEAYELYLKGRHLLHTFNQDQIKSGVAILKEAITLAPDYALAHSAVHYGYNLLAAAGFMPGHQAQQEGSPYLERALKLDSDLPECYHSLGWHALNYEWDFIQAKEHLNKAISISPAYADAHQKLFITLALEGKITEAKHHIDKAIALDPLSALNHYFLGYYHYLSKDYIKAISSYDRSTALSPGFLFTYGMKALAQAGLGDLNGLRKTAREVGALPNGGIDELLVESIVQAIDQPEQLDVNINKLQSSDFDFEKERIRFFIIQLLTMSGQHDQALQQIKIGIENKEPLMTLLRPDPILGVLQAQPDFKDMMRAVYLKSGQTEATSEASSTEKDSSSNLRGHEERLRKLIEEEQLHLNPALTLRSLAERLELHPNKLSLLLNEVLGSNFNEFINEYRLETFKSRALDPSLKHLTILAIAFESGFNSKTVFNTYFKKSTGLSPREWLNEQKA